LISYCFESHRVLNFCYEVFDVQIKTYLSLAYNKLNVLIRYMWYLVATLYNLNGQIVSEMNLNNNLNDGLYLLRVRDDEGKIESLKVIFSSVK
jgi:hypothetical protein